ncbi:MAG: hypothetical protein MK101_09585 [Phycisphaerales bacterium]|nr:hypothetical protein [Phycisphaerales bacterium]
MRSTSPIAALTAAALSSVTLAATWTVDDDGGVDVGDLLEVIANWGLCDS